MTLAAPSLNVRYAGEAAFAETVMPQVFGVRCLHMPQSFVPKPDTQKNARFTWPMWPDLPCRLSGL